MAASESDVGETVAALDLGSNSFHMVVARRQHGELRVLDRIKVMVRLGEGLDARGRLSPDVRERAMQALQRFGERLKALPRNNVRVVGTNALRGMRKAQAFLVAAETALGHPVEVISGVEEARLIYIGVCHSLGDDAERRLVVDIGGGSTELIVGAGAQPICMDSLEIGCVSLTRKCLTDGRLNANTLSQAALTVGQELEPVLRRYHHSQWQHAIGASGSVRSVQAVLGGLGLAHGDIDLSGLQALRQQLVDAGRLDRLALPGLETARKPVFAGGVMVLLGVFEALGVERMAVSDGALREGVLHDLIGRMDFADVRDQTVSALVKRYHVDVAHADRVTATAEHLFRQVQEPWDLDAEAQRWLRWGAQLHEIGLDIAHGGYHRHGEYLARHSDLGGFSSQDQAVLAALIRCHRRKIADSALDGVPDNRRVRVERLVPLLRLAVILHRSRLDEPGPDVQLGVQPGMIMLVFPRGWLLAHPLTRADLDVEAEALERLELTLRLQEAGGTSA
ncbi:Ppx/GppA phosphatase family protein [Aquisalimonas sp.]|uniref:Ppx/GppA phosphatase family protein n=1 Tax=Aquisalimonas sp. TaxID=1872621 RepID=UPI0025C21ECB|nr:Ppx/GppA phosphatase family protein [Aquisalimonas sp.]